MPTTTLPYSGPIVLPDCSRFPDDVASADILDAIDPGRLVRALAEQGVDGARALVREQAREDAALRTRLDHLRERIRRQAERDIQRQAETYDRALDQLSIVERRTQAELDQEMAELEEKLRLSRARGLGAFRLPELEAEVTAALLVPDASWNRPPRPTLWQRIRAWFARLFQRLFHRRSAATSTPAAGRRVPIATLSLDGRTLGPSALGDALAQLSVADQQELTERVGARIRASEADVRRAADAKRKEAELQRRQIEKEKAAAEERARSQLDRRAKEAEDRRIDRELKERGLLVEHGADLVVTYGLVERFARLLLQDTERSAPTEVRFALRGGAATGVYEKARLRQPDEVARMDVPSSLIAARMSGSRHLEESTSYIYREATGESVHVVLAFDRSGSMAEDHKLEAAKKALLALYVAVRKKYPTASVDVLAFENEVRVLDLLELWKCSPGSFTNTAEVIRVAHRLLESSRAHRKEFFLITDGLPEAYTDAEGRVRSGQLETAMDHALSEARALTKVHPLRFSMLLLKSTHPEYEAAARAIARTIGGELIVTDPEHLGVELLVRWAHGGETVERPRPELRPPPVVTTPRTTRRRKADRRMGG